jgi:hypothetical protein
MGPAYQQLSVGRDKWSSGWRSCAGRAFHLDVCLTANFCKDGPPGKHVPRQVHDDRETYAGNTNVRIDLMTDALTASP